MDGDCVEAEEVVVLVSVWKERVNSWQINISSTTRYFYQVFQLSCKKNEAIYKKITSYIIFESGFIVIYSIKESDFANSVSLLDHFC